MIDRWRFSQWNEPDKLYLEDLLDSLLDQPAGQQFPFFSRRCWWWNFGPPTFHISSNNLGGIGYLTAIHNQAAAKDSAVLPPVRCCSPDQLTPGNPSGD